MSLSVTLLALDASTPRAALALAMADGSIRTAEPDPSARHGRALVPAIRDLLAAAGLKTRDLDGLVVGLGPGSYTGLRVGLTAAKTLAYAAGRPLVGIDSLELVARNAPADALHVAVVADAQRGDVYAAAFSRQAPGSPLVRVTETQVVPLDAWRARLPAGVYTLGPAYQVPRLFPLLPPADPDARHAPDALALAALASDAWAEPRRDDPFFLEPMYLRRSSAEEQWERKGG